MVISDYLHLVSFLASLKPLIMLSRQQQPRPSQLLDFAIFALYSRGFSMYPACVQREWRCFCCDGDNSSYCSVIVYLCADYIQLSRLRRPSPLLCMNLDWGFDANIAMLKVGEGDNPQPPNRVESAFPWSHKSDYQSVVWSVVHLTGITLGEYWKSFVPSVAWKSL